MLKKGKEITVFLALTLILSGCGGEKEKSRSEVKAAAAVSVQSTRETAVSYTHLNSGREKNAENAFTVFQA